MRNTKDWTAREANIHYAEKLYTTGETMKINKYWGETGKTAQKIQEEKKLSVVSLLSSLN